MYRSTILLIMAMGVTACGSTSGRYHNTGYWYDGGVNHRYHDAFYTHGHIRPYSHSIIRHHHVKPGKPVKLHHTRPHHHSVRPVKPHHTRPHHHPVKPVKPIKLHNTRPQHYPHKPVKTHHTVRHHGHAIKPGRAIKPPHIRQNSTHHHGGRPSLRHNANVKPVKTGSHWRESDDGHRHGRDRGRNQTNGSVRNSGRWNDFRNSVTK